MKRLVMTAALYFVALPRHSIARDVENLCTIGAKLVEKLRAANIFCRPVRRDARRSRRVDAVFAIRSLDRP
jgi:hypothetical protein